MKTDYVLISPCKDEGAYIERTLKSIEAQTIKPVQWVIVDDGSVDNSMELVKKYQSTTMPFIKIVTRTTGDRQVGPGVIRAFNAGLEQVDVPYDFLCKFDVDLELSAVYFEEMLKRMDKDPLLGTCSGKAYYLHPVTGERKSELCGDEASVGMIKFYRRECFEQIGGFVVEVGWDGFDCHMARWHGWRAISWDDEPIQFLHLRPMGSSQKNIYKGRIRHGRGQYLLGAHPLFFIISSVYRSVKQRPYVTGTLYSMKGYFGAMMQGEKQFGSKDIVHFIRSYQLKALRMGKRDAAEWAFQQRKVALGK